eukprot:scaffold2659_cov275-Pinguiococcus_pyrenoidosus.AAC.3
MRDPASPFNPPTHRLSERSRPCERGVLPGVMRPPIEVPRGIHDRTDRHSRRRAMIPSGALQIRNGKQRRETLTPRLFVVLTAQVWQCGRRQRDGRCQRAAGRGTRANQTGCLGEDPNQGEGSSGQATEKRSRSSRKGIP